MFRNYLISQKNSLKTPKNKVWGPPVISKTASMKRQNYQGKTFFFGTDFNFKSVKNIDSISRHEEIVPCPNFSHVENKQHVCIWTLKCPWNMMSILIAFRDQL